MKNLLILFFFAAGLSAWSQVAINTDGAVSDNSAMLDVKSANKGLLVPRVALTGTLDATTIASPATSLLIYNTATAGVSPNNVTPGYYYWNGTAWTRLSVSAGGSGTTNYIPKWTSTGALGNSLLFDNGSNIGIGTATPGAKLDVAGRIWQTNTGQSVFLGENAGTNDDLTGNQNVFIGYQAGKSNTTGYYNTANGAYALFSNTSSNQNSANGYYALYSNTTGNYNTANGSYTLYSNTAGFNNSAIGVDALFSNTTGSSNTGNGNDVLFSNTTGSYNSAHGSYALYFNTTGRDNTANGTEALFYNTTGYSNVAVGIRSLYKNTSRTNLVAVGDSALYNNGTGAAGAQAMGNTAVGSKALYANTTGYSNTANGYNALYSNTTGSANTGNGSLVLSLNTTGSSNTANGYYALYSNTTGNYNTANGDFALFSNTTGSSNTANGSYALYNNSSGNFNTALGYSADAATYNLSNVTVIGANASASASNQVRLGDGSITTLYCMGAYAGTVGTTNRDLYADNTGKIGYVSSSARYKDDIENMESVDWLYKLRPVNFTYKTDESKIKQYGLIAEEVEEVKPEFISYNDEGVPETVSYSSMISPLIKAVQEQKAVIENQQVKIEDQQKQIDELKIMVRELISR